MRLIDAEPIIKNLTAMKTQLGYDAIDIDGMIKALRDAEEVTNSDPTQAGGGNDMKNLTLYICEICGTQYKDKGECE